MPPYQTGSGADEAQIYTPREDTFLLLKTAGEEVLSSDQVLEVGTGSGCIASGLPSCRLVVATDISPHALRVAKRRRVQGIQTDLVSGLRRVFSLVLFNPPYLPTKPGERLEDWLEYALDGGEDGREVLERFLGMVPEVVIPGGRILLLVSSLQDFAETEDLFSRYGFSKEIKDRERLDDGEELRVYRLVKVQSGS